MIYPVAFRRLQPQIGFAWAARVVGFVCLVTIIVSFAAMRAAKRQTPRQKLRSIIDPHAFTKPPLVIYALALFFLYAGFWVPFFLHTFVSQDVSTNSGRLVFLYARYH